ncbi:hypothetical protein SLEP1_g39279 [Rubroshorea leprosula]|uniref:Uncharacterized protein n=1 Tax=Rubroshorea leprosula TaxID=152421 RepID=A0AAV5KZQ9_9ROSI|nr:hypothetical protein SLEP1_g39279 [Rubroshorea leprosula]
MEEWEEWDYESRGEEDITIMPRLSSLTIRYCRKLKMLPDYILQSTTLQELSIIGCPIISKCCKEDYQSFIDRIPHSDVRPEVDSFRSCVHGGRMMDRPGSWRPH